MRHLFLIMSICDPEIFGIGQNLYQSLSFPTSDIYVYYNQNMLSQDLYEGL